MEWEFPAASTLAAWWGAATGSVALLINWLNRRDAVAEKARDKKAKTPWVVLEQAVSADREVRFNISVHNPKKEVFTISRVELVKPKGYDVVATYTSGQEVKDIEPARFVEVSWPVAFASKALASEVTACSAAVWLRKRSSTWRSALIRPGSAMKDNQFEINFSGETAPPMRDPVRITAKVTIEP